MSFDTSHVIQAQIDAEGCAAAELWLNGFPISRIVTSRGIRGESAAVQQLLVPGMNRLELVVEPGERPSTSRTDRVSKVLESAKAKAWVVRYPDDAEPTPELGQILAEVAFETPTPKTDPYEWPQTRSQAFEMGAAAGRWSWQDAPELVLDERLVAEAHGVLLELGHTIKLGALEPYFRLTEIQIRDALRAYPAVTEDFIRADLEQFLAHYKKVKEPVMPLEADKHDFRLVAAGRVLQCIDVDGSSSLKLRDPGDGSPVPCPVFLARVDGALRVVR